MITRRNFIYQSTMAAGSLLFSPLQSCSSSDSKYQSILRGPDSKAGHLIRDQRTSPPREIVKEDVVIVGGGVAGLSAARWLKKAGQSFRLLELESEIGGNSRSGRNKISAFPLGAHYLPLPDIHNRELLSFLKDCGVITGYNGEIPVYNEYYLCHDPKERLFINHHWQEGLIPAEGIPQRDRDEIKKFLDTMETYRNKIGNDGKIAFTIPVKNSSQDSSLLQLDKISMDRYLKENGFNSAYLRWYVNYCCADDFGATLNNTSAWAGIHYFASRKGSAANSKFDDVLTWPEGNHWLVKQLAKDLTAEEKNQSAVSQVRINNKKVEVDYFDVRENTFKRIEAKAVIMASPQFVNKYLLQSFQHRDYNAFHYAPWMVANLTVDSSLQERRGEPLSWDNVIYGSESLGYVHAAHQNISIPQNKTVITFYQPITNDDCGQARKKAQTRTLNQWEDLIFNELKSAHPDLRKMTSEIDIYLWGHGMIRPEPGFVWSESRMKAAEPIDNKIFFAHSDLSGISIFEEAFESGIQAAAGLLNTLG